MRYEDGKLLFATQGGNAQRRSDAVTTKQPKQRGALAGHEGSRRAAVKSISSLVSVGVSVLTH